MKSLAIILLFISFRAISQSDTLIVEIIYGSKPLSKNGAHWFGGKLGGHIGLTIGEDSVMHFLPGGRVAATNINSDIGKYIISNKRRFYRTFSSDTLKTCRIFIPVTSTQKQQLLNDSKSFLKEGPYPYAFFGMRCAAACYHLLSLADVTKDLSRSKMTWKFIYPRKFRKHLFKEALKNNWKIIETKGDSKRKWDHD
ncbi:hypothetical protein [Fluviicola taffensis]|uniref:DUF4105 domain-containing protein n=1 Tax=Fluviicola taffensis (strain DSM 16823 / NCIMB 13979 / RW262) TaxID=755732 RepID=F2IJE4_FLUTR|nr:hypothetical protein [Fluviicola taffensis]AEA46041.1 hypothetical protein Fluta_4079 [Fluviicola taffensis DSM 16823]